MTRTQMAIFVDFGTEIGRTRNSHFLFLNMARSPRTTQSHLGKGSEKGAFFTRGLLALEALLQMTPI